MNSINKSIFLLSPILAVYITIVLLFGADVPLGDGIRFWAYAGNILNGTYATSEVGMLHMGPGYPIVLSVFRALGIPIIIPLLLNAVLLFSGCFFFYKTLRKYINLKAALVISYVFAFWDPFLLYWTQKLYSEPLVVFLVCFGIYYYLNYQEYKIKKHLYFTAISFGYLTLTKVIFGYVLGAFLLLNLLSLFFSKNKGLIKSNIFISLMALAICLPYLGYTFKETGKFFYWGNSGGELLYWTASPHQTDLGEWHTGGVNMNDFFSERYHLSGVDPKLVYDVNEIITNRIYSDHKDFKNRLNGLGAYQADALYKKEAIKNIKAYPLNFIKNWIMNIGRITLGYPHALFAKPPFSAFLSLLNIVKSSILISLSIVASILFLFNIKSVTPKERYIFLFGLIYFGGVSLLAAQSQRFMIPFTPILFLWIVIVFRNLKLRLNGI